MKTILAINPAKVGHKKSRKPSAKRGGTMAAPKKRRKRRRPAAPKAITRRRKRYTRRNPSSRARSAARRAGGMIGALKIPTAFINALKSTGGMLAAQYAAKRFAEGGGANDPTWTWKNYAFGVAGAFAAGIGGELIKKGSGYQFLQGGLSLMMYKMVTNELVEKSPWVAENLGETTYLTPDVVLGTDGNYYSPGDTYLGQDGEVYLLGENGYWAPVTAEMGGTLAPPTALGGSLAPPGVLGDAADYERVLGSDGDPYARAFGSWN